MDRPAEQKNGTWKKVKDAQHSIYGELPSFSPPALALVSARNPDETWPLGWTSSPLLRMRRRQWALWTWKVPSMARTGRSPWPGIPASRSGSTPLGLRHQGRHYPAKTVSGGSAPDRVDGAKGPRTAAAGSRCSKVCACSRRVGIIEYDPCRSRGTWDIS